MSVKEGQEEPLKRMAKVCRVLIDHPDSAPFCEPVDWRGLELFDYPEIVKKMMDLGSIQKKLERQQYPTAWKCAQDIRLVWQNCMAYNAEGSDFWLLAKSFSRKFEDRFRKIRYEFDVGEEEDEEEEEDNASEEEDEEEEFDDNETGIVATPESVKGRQSTGGTPSLDARAQLAHDILALKGVEMGYVMSLLERECPECLEIDPQVPEHLELNLDAASPKIFAKITEYASEQASTRKRGVGIEDIVLDDVSGKRRRKR